MNEIMHIVSPQSAAWVGWTMFVLLLCGVLAELWQPGVISQAGVSLSSRTDRTYKESPATFLGQTMIHLFRTGTIAMGLCLCFYEGGAFRFVDFALVCGLIVVVLILKILLNWLLDYTFTLRRRFPSAYEDYSNLGTISVLVLYPLLLIVLRFSKPMVAMLMMLIVAVIFLGMWIYRGGRLFISSPSSIIYFALYILTLEVLPLGILYVGTGLMLTNL